MRKEEVIPALSTPGRCARAPALQQRGITLVELMVGIAVMAILLAIAVPSFESSMARNRVTAVANDLLAAIQLARTEAIRRGMRVTLCKKAAASDQCDGNAGAWSNGWLVFTDPSLQTPPQVDNGSTLLARGGDNLPAFIVIRGNIRNEYASYIPTGASKQMNGSFLAGTLRVCSTSAALDDDARARDIKINSVGRAVIERPTGIPSSCPSP